MLNTHDDMKETEIKFPEKNAIPDKNLIVYNQWQIKYYRRKDQWI
jgi:hypothetical protein